MRPLAYGNGIETASGIWCDEVRKKYRLQSKRLFTITDCKGTEVLLGCTSEVEYCVAICLKMPEIFYKGD